MQKTCNNCGDHEKELLMMPYVVHEAEMIRADRDKKRMWIIILALIFLLVGTNVAWLIYESQFETVETITEEYQVEASDGGNAIINDEGSVNING